MKRLITDDVKQTIFHSHDGNDFIETHQDVSAIVEANKASFNQFDERTRWGEFDKVASIPLAVIDDLNKQGIMRGFAVIDAQRMKIWLNNPDNRFFRTRPGQV
jgi:hypothetical protein